VTRALFGEAFAIYPWMIDSQYEDVIGTTPAMIGTHNVEEFKGQSSPTVFRAPLQRGDIDRPLLDALLTRWRACHETARPQWRDIALFRSLNMAYHASLLPSGSEATFYDAGRLVSLWVSAFEILVHPGGTGRADRDKVIELLEKTPWQNPIARRRSYAIGGKAKAKRTLASRLYQSLYERRNDFLHGNPVARGDLTVRTSNRSILDYAAPLYRLALTAFLHLSYDQPIPALSDGQAFGAYVASRMSFLEPQSVIEKAILTARRSRKSTATGHVRLGHPTA
jgi:hypothetical protein